MNPKANDRPKADNALSAEWLEVVRKKAEELSFGSIQIIVHEGRVTQVESLEKTRFPAKNNEPGLPT
jgi:hypothetical protein